jgi:hypothetical protein
MDKTFIKILATTAVLILLTGIRYSFVEHSRLTVTTDANECINNLRVIDGAKIEWALEKHKTTNDVPTWADLRPYILNRYPDSIPVCPWGGTYVIGKVGELPTCSFKGPLAHQLN